MKNRSTMTQISDFLLGKGFYIVLLLCVATIGVTGYYLVRSVTADPAEELEAVTGDASVVLPDPEPVSVPDKPPAIPFRPTIPDQPDDPEPVRQDPDPAPEPVPQPTILPETPVATVFTWPVKGEVIRDFSVETLMLDPTLGDWRTHGGLDVAANLGVDVLSMGAGTVVQVYEDGLMGTSVLVDHGEGLTALYCNLAQAVPVKNGDTVEPGTILGTVGQSAIAESGLEPHLHLEAWKDGTPLDPREFLPEE